MHDLWIWDPKNCGERMDGWRLVTDNVWGCADNPGRDGKSDFMLKVRDDQIWTFGGDREVMSPWPQDNDVWVAECPAPDCDAFTRTGPAPASFFCVYRSIQ